MTGTRWIPRDADLAIHDELLVEHGGLAGMRDEGAFEASLARPRSKQAYEAAGLHVLAAAYGFAFARNHPFNDGNKRVALATVDVFLRMNGHELVASEVDAVATFRDLAAGALDEAGLVEWIERNSRPLA